MPRSGWTRLAVALLALCAVATLVEPVVSIGDPVSRNYNEGWNALHADTVMHGGDLYPEPGAPVFNNYPPTSFLVMAVLGAIFGDPLVAGRVVALVSLIVVVVCVGRIASAIAACRAIGVLAAVLALGLVTVHYDQYVAMNDPQLFGHALQFLGLTLFVRRLDDPRARLGSLVLVVLGGTVKHNLVAVPLALVVWMLWHRRAQAPRFVSTGVALVAVGVLAMFLAHGSDLFAGVLGHARTFVAYRAANMIAAWLVPLAPVLGAGLLTVTLGRRDPRVDLLALVGGIGLLTGAVFAGGGGINYNVVYDAVFAASALAALGVNHLARAVRSAPDTHDAVRAVASIAVGLTVLLALPARLAEDRTELRERPAELAAARADLAFLENHPGPIFCSTLALAHWAGRDFEVDTFNFGQAVRTGARDDEDLVARIVAGEFAVIQFNEWSRRVDLTPDVLDAIETHYRPARTSPAHGRFYVPRGS
ncbi:MAG TPA: glycosyltransferase family 39 protein [Candidatus Krumholzibacteria bacterium]|nr:glycosyltransferase family 39 protein [Candidatus Krumholzibacteria bacterium]